MAPVTNPVISKPSTPSSTHKGPPNKSATSKTPNLNGLGRSPSLRGGISRPGKGGPLRSSGSQNGSIDDNDGDETRAENIALMDELRTRVAKAETASEEYQRQLNLLQARLDEAQQSQTRLEDQVHERDGQLEQVRASEAQAIRLGREAETQSTSEREAMLQERAEHIRRDEESQAIIRRLRDSLSARESKMLVNDNRDSSRSSADQFAPQAIERRAESSDQAKIIALKDRVIESLRLELAETQIKIMEIDSMSGGQLHDLEKKLMEVSIENARLTEDNESFQLLLSEKTLNGDFSKTDTMQNASFLGSLAEELGTEELESAEGKSDAYRRLELDNKAMKDQNKALSLYVEKIIGRLLEHKDFDNIFDKNPDLMSGAPRAIPAGSLEKDLPPPPPPKDGEGVGGFLQRARTVVAGSGKRPRPTSQIGAGNASVAEPAAPLPSGPHEDPATAPSVPLGRSMSVRNTPHKRTQSELANAAPIVNQMYRGPPSTGLTGPLGSPGLSPSSTGGGRTSFFAQHSGSPNTTPRAPQASFIPASTSAERNPGSSSNSTFSDHSGSNVGGTPGSVDSPPRTNNYTGAVMTQNRLRPLRLVQENTDIETLAARKEEDRKKANRSSWMPAWMGPRSASTGE